MKTKPKELLDEIGDDFCNYLNRGLNPKSFTAKVEPSLNIPNLQRLLDIHFLISDKVQAFVEQLPRRMRRISTSTSSEKETTRGEIRGRISWNDTVKHRYSTNPDDNSTYVCDRRERDYNTDENRVLKTLLKHLNRILDENETLVETDDLEWFEDWTGDGELLSTFRDTWRRNIHLRNIHIRDVTVTSRMITTARNSRKALYREAGKLLTRYRQLKNHNVDPEHAHKLLKDTFIKPNRDEVLFELYWVVRLIRHYSNRDDVSDLNFRLIEPGTNKIATWNDPDHEYHLYHNSTGSFRLHETFDRERVQLNKLPDGYLYRTGQVIDKFEQLTDRKQDTLWGGRPDLLVEKYRHKQDKDNDMPDQVIIGEVKYTDRDEYAMQGLRELLEYMAFLRTQSEKYYTDQDGVLDTPDVTGLLFSDAETFALSNPDQNVNVLTGPDKIHQVL
jgi:hypothetical protein